ncbi:MAG: class I SAM-dependent DNA methyltransferase [Woeseiaceae bacterium]
MSNKEKISLGDAYAVETPDDNIQLYKDWADTYDADFVAATGYVGYQRAAEFFLKLTDRPAGPVLDVGCGTGVVGIALRDGGVDEVDGIDISQAMLNQAGKKKSRDGSIAYRNLIPADLTETINLQTDSYAGLVSAGTFTHGHLGPESLDELWRVAAPGAVCSIGINAAHFDSQGFAEKIANDVKHGTVTEPDIHIVDTYLQKRTDVADENNQAMIVVCRVI